MNEQVVHATVRESGDEDWLDIECRFSNGEKYTAVQVVAEKPWLAHRIAELLITSQTNPRTPTESAVTNPSDTGSEP